MSKLRFGHGLAFILGACLASGAGDAVAQAPMLPEPVIDLLRQCHVAIDTEPSRALALGAQVLALQELHPDARVQALDCRMRAGHNLGDQSLPGMVDALLEATAAEGVTPAVAATGRANAAVGMQEVGRVEEALALLRQVRSEAEAIGNVRLQIQALTMAATVYDTALDDTDSVLAHFDEAVRLAATLPGPPSAADAGLHYNHGYVLLRRGRLEQADVAFARAEAIAALPQGSELLRQRIASGRAAVLLGNGKASEALDALAAILAEQARLDDVPGQVVTRQRMARALLAMGQPQRALVEAEAVQELANTASQRDGLQLLIEINAALGDREAVARHTHALREMARDSARGKVAAELARLEADGRPREGTGISRSTWIAITLLVLVLVVSAVLLWRARRRQRQLQKLGAIDPLTGLLNRGEGTRRVRAALDAGGAAAGALLVIDLDHFKKINDIHGHAVGDQALVAVAGCLRAICGVDDVLARWGGEEFVLHRQGLDLAAAEALAADLCRRIAGLGIQAPDGQCLSVTASIGASPLPLCPGGQASFTDSLRAADRAMYEAKHGGRDGWASISGVPGGAVPDLELALSHPARAVEEGVLRTGSSRPMPWLPISGEARETIRPHRRS